MSHAGMADVMFSFMGTAQEAGAGGRGSPSSHRLKQGAPLRPIVSSCGPA